MHRKLVSALAIAAALTVSLVACAPEPGAEGPESGTGQGGKGKEGSSEGHQNNPVPTEAFEKTVELPDSFPSDAFVIPVGATIDDTGERSETEWFVVLSAADQAAADELWAQVIAESGFTASDAQEGPDGSSATLTNATLLVTALTLPQEDGSVLLSYDLAVAG